MQKRGFTDLPDERLIKRGDKVLRDLFSKGCHSIRQLTADESDAKAFYRFLQNDRVSQEAIINNVVANCQAACKGKRVVCIQDTTEINLSSHAGRISKDEHIGTTNAKKDKGLGFFIHPSLVLDAEQCIPYGYAAVKLWSRSSEFTSKHERGYKKLPIEQKESYKWIEVSKQTETALANVVESMVIIQDREGDIYEQFALTLDKRTDLLIRSRGDRRLADGSKLFNCLSDQPSMGDYKLFIPAKATRPKRTAAIEVRYKEVEMIRPHHKNKEINSSVKLYLVEAKETNYNGSDKICWRLLTTIPVISTEIAMLCIEWYSWRWIIEEVFKILKKEGYNIESSELEYALSVKKMCLLIMETTIKLFLMRLAYAEPEIDISADACFTNEEQQFLEHQITHLEGKTSKQKNPHRNKDLKRYVWAIARLGGWKGYESKRHPGITTIWTGLKYFKAAFQGWEIHRNVSTR